MKSISLRNLNNKTTDASIFSHQKMKREIEHMKEKFIKWEAKGNL